jgi:uncharacterized SAM-binding protein YcdF (DUF218 family)
VLIVVFHKTLLRGCATLLMHEDKLQQAEAIFVLSGGSYDRGNEAVRLFNAGYCNTIVCTGGNPYLELKVFNIDTLESDMAVANLKRQGVPDSCVIQLKYGTSTREEFDTIIEFCKQHHLKRIIVLSSRLHTARVNSVFRKKMDEAGIDLILHGAPSSRFNEYLWWESEDGLIAVNNEWIKTIYYWWKY